MSMIRTSYSNKKRRLVFGKYEEAADFITLFYFALKKPLTIWEKQIITGSIKRIEDPTNGSTALQILGSRVISSNISTPPEYFGSLGIKLPILTLITKFFGRPFAFEVQVWDSLNAKRRIRFSNIQVMSRRNSQTVYVPIHLDIGWNDLKIDLAYLIRAAYGTRYKETIRIQIFPNCYLRAVYFSSVPISDAIATALIRKTFYDQSNQEKDISDRDPSTLNLKAYKAGHLSLLVPKNLQEFLAFKANQIIEIAKGNPLPRNWNPEKAQLNTTRKMNIEKSRTQLNTPENMNLVKAKLNSLMKLQEAKPILLTTRLSTNKSFQLTESDKAFISMLNIHKDKKVSSLSKITALYSKNVSYTTISRPLTQISKMQFSKSIDELKLMDLKRRISIPKVSSVKSLSQSRTRVTTAQILESRASLSSRSRIKSLKNLAPISISGRSSKGSIMNMESQSLKKNVAKGQINSQASLRKKQVEKQEKESKSSSDPMLQNNNNQEVSYPNKEQIRHQIYGFLDCNLSSIGLFDDYDIPISRKLINSENAKVLQGNEPINATNESEPTRNNAESIATEPNTENISEHAEL